MKTWVVMAAYNPIEVIVESLKRFQHTANNAEVMKVMIDHHWPKNTLGHSKDLLEFAVLHGWKVVRPLQNMGAHGAYEWAARALPYGDDDLVIHYDSDVNPLQHGWVEAMEEVMRADRRMGAVSLSHRFTYDAPGRTWTEEHIAAHLVKFCEPYSVTNITMLRASFLKKHGLGALRPYYGYVENWLRDTLNKEGLRQGYLAHFWEGDSTVAPDEDYVRWKVAHAHAKTTDLNFDEWLKAEGKG